ncbi:MAG: inorganic phosphate transporter [Bacteroidetes bacterium]|nr:inorganic phosphate transporter [Bacteroidota bacterium]
MITLLFLSSGLFLGWSLGANDAANIFGTAVGTRMVRFRTAAILGSIFVIIGAVIQGAGASHTLGELGKVSTLAAAFTVALAAALTVFWMTRLSLPVSTSQAIVGAIIGWNFYTDNPTDIEVLTKIVSTWVSGPILGGFFAVLLFMLLQLATRKAKVHLLYKDALVRIGLLVIGAFGAYSLGANNIANVMGVFTDAIHFPEIQLGWVVISGKQQLFLIGGLAIAAGIITYSKHVMETVGNTLMPLTPEAALVVVLSQALVLFIFSSQTLSNAVVSLGLPAIPLVPVSSSQVVIGSIIGIGLYKGGREIKLNILGSISLGWIATPIAAGILSFFMLFFVNNVFKQEVGSNLMENLIKKEILTPSPAYPNVTEMPDVADTLELVNNSVHLTSTKTETPEPAIYWVTGTLALLMIVTVVIIWFRFSKKKKIWLTASHQLQDEHRLQIEALQKKLSERSAIQEDMDKELKFRQNEMTTMAMNIIHKNEFLNDLKKEIATIKGKMKDPESRHNLNKLTLMISQNISIDRDREKFQLHVDEQNTRFLQLLSENFPSMTENEKRLATLLRLNLSSKEIASILNISPKSVEMNRYRLRKKLGVPGNVGLTEFIREL